MSVYMHIYIYMCDVMPVHFVVDATCLYTHIKSSPLHPPPKYDIHCHIEVRCLNGKGVRTFNCYGVLTFWYEGVDDFSQPLSLSFDLFVV